MRIAMVSEHASPLAVLGGVDAGGQNVYVAQLAEALAAQGVEVVVHTRRDDPGLDAEVGLCPGVIVHHVDAGPPRPLPKDELLVHMERFADELTGRWRTDPPDVVHAHFWMSGHASLIAARAVGVPVVQTFHALGVVKRRYQGDRDTSPPQRLAIERDLARRADRVVATCSDEVFELVRLGASRSRLTVIPCGANLERFTPTRDPGEPPPDAHRIVTLGRLVERKGIGNAISALRELPGVELVIGGGPPRSAIAADPEARRLHVLARREGVADRVVLHGQVVRERAPAFLRSAAAVVAVPWYEPFGIVPVEAMACGVPVVASAVGGMIDTIVDGVTGVHVPPRDPERLSGALRALLDDPARRAAYGRAGVRRARRLYDWHRIAGAMLEVYGQVARRPRRARRTAPAANGAAAAAARWPERVPSADEHLAALADALALVEGESERIEELGTRLAARLLAGGRVLAVGNGGSAAEAQHFTAELVGRYRAERQGLSALCLHGDTSALTAIGNDYGPEEAFARQVRAHGRPGDVLIAFSTSGRSPNVLAAAQAARATGMETWALTGEAASPLADRCDEALRLPARDTATVQELHLVAVHLLCGAVDREVALRERIGVRRLASDAPADGGDAGDGGTSGPRPRIRRGSHRRVSA